MWSSQPLGFQGALQGAGTPNQAGIGGFLPLSVGKNSVFFADVQANVNFADLLQLTAALSIPEVAGTTISTSSRLGYRWFNGDRSMDVWRLTAGYDSRPMALRVLPIQVFRLLAPNKRSVFFQQGGSQCRGCIKPLVV